MLKFGDYPVYVRMIDKRFDPLKNDLFSHIRAIRFPWYRKEAR